MLSSNMSFNQEKWHLRLTDPMLKAESRKRIEADVRKEDLLVTDYDEKDASLIINGLKSQCSTIAATTRSRKPFMVRVAVGLQKASRSAWGSTYTSEVWPS